MAALRASVCQCQSGCREERRQQHKAFQRIEPLAEEAKSHPPKLPRPRHVMAAVTLSGFVLLLLPLVCEEWRHLVSRGEANCTLFSVKMLFRHRIDSGFISPWRSWRSVTAMFCPGLLCYSPSNIWMRNIWIYTSFHRMKWADFFWSYLVYTKSNALLFYQINESFCLRHQKSPVTQRFSLEPRASSLLASVLGKWMFLRFLS